MLITEEYYTRLHTASVGGLWWVTARGGPDYSLFLSPKEIIAGGVERTPPIFTLSTQRIRNG